MAAFRQWHCNLAPLLADRPGALTLFDGRPEHFVIRNGRLAGVIDLHDVGAGDPAMDLAVLSAADPPLLDGVLNGYRASDSERTEFDALIPFYAVLRRLAAAEWDVRQHIRALNDDLLHHLERPLARLLGVTPPS